VSDRLYIALDVSLAPGPRFAQLAHAVAEIFSQRPADCAAWRAATNTLVILEVPGDRLARLATRRGAVPFREPDLGNELTAVALFPEDPETIKLLRRERLAS
jgi:hypothetical protein